MYEVHELAQQKHVDDCLKCWVQHPVMCIFWISKQTKSSEKGNYKAKDELVYSYNLMNVLVFFDVAYIFVETLLILNPSSPYLQNLFSSDYMPIKIIINHQVFQKCQKMSNLISYVLLSTWNIAFEKIM